MNIQDLYTEACENGAELQYGFNHEPIGKDKKFICLW